MVDDIRPDLHRYCTRLTGSVIDGEDIVQDALAKGFYALSLMTEPPPLRPWLFRIAHNAALDHLKRHDRKHTELRSELDDVAGYTDAPDPALVRLALARFLELPTNERSAVILKDVLGHSLAEAAETMGSTIPAVKAALVRARTKLRAAPLREADDAPVVSASDKAGRERLERYAALFNARDWDGVRALVGDHCRLDLVSKSERRGKEVGMYFGRYAKENISLAVVRLLSASPKGGELALAAFVGDAKEPAYFILLGWDGERVSDIRDFRYVPYIATDASFERI